MGKSKNKDKSEKVTLLRQQYEAFLEEERRRRDRNEYILRRLDTMRGEGALVVPALPAAAAALHPTQLVRAKDMKLFAGSQNLTVQGLTPPVRSFINMIPSHRTQNELNDTVPISENRESTIEQTILKEISKKYILIPKLKSQHAYETAPYYSNEQMTAHISGADHEWKSKYDILNKLNHIDYDENNAMINDNGTIKHMEINQLEKCNYKISPEKVDGSKHDKYGDISIKNASAEWDITTMTPNNFNKKCVTPQSTLSSIFSNHDSKEINKPLHNASLDQSYSIHPKTINKNNNGKTLDQSQTLGLGDAVFKSSPEMKESEENTQYNNLLPNSSYNDQIDLSSNKNNLLFTQDSYHGSHTMTQSQDPKKYAQENNSKRSTDVIECTKILTRDQQQNKELIQSNATVYRPQEEHQMAQSLDQYGLHDFEPEMLQSSEQNLTDGQICVQDQGNDQSASVRAYEESNPSILEGQYEVSNVQGQYKDPEQYQDHNKPAEGTNQDNVQNPSQSEMHVQFNDVNQTVPKQYDEHIQQNEGLYEYQKPPQREVENHDNFNSEQYNITNPTTTGIYESLNKNQLEAEQGNYETPNQNDLHVEHDDPNNAVQGQYEDPNQNAIEGQYEYPNQNEPGQYEDPNSTIQGHYEDNSLAAQGQYEVPSLATQAHYDDSNLVTQGYYEDPNLATHENYQENLTQGQYEDSNVAMQGQYEEPSLGTQGHYQEPSHMTEGQFEDPNLATQGHYADPSLATQGPYEDLNLATQEQYENPGFITQGQYQEPSITNECNYQDPNLASQVQYDDPSQASQGHYQDPNFASQGHYEDPSLTTQGQYQDHSNASQIHYENSAREVQEQFNDPNQIAEGQYEETTQGHYQYETNPNYTDQQQSEYSRQEDVVTSIDRQGQNMVNQPVNETQPVG